jgi:hypothetical protein
VGGEAGEVLERVRVGSGMRSTWRMWLPVVLAVAGISCGIGLADQGRQSAALVLLGFSLAIAAVAVGVWLHYDQGGDDDER